MERTILFKKSIKEILLDEFKRHIKNQVYYKCQCSLAARSNQIEGNTLTESDTFTLFDTQLVPANGYKANEIEEAQGHFLMFNLMLKTLDMPLTTNLIKRFHRELTQGITEFRDNYGTMGEYKKINNIVGGMKTAPVNLVDYYMEGLVNIYNDEDKTLENLAKFHANFEHIHPFQDYNGRVGRLILFRESLLLDKPIVISFEDKYEYVKALNIARENQYDDIIQFMKIEQDKFYEELKGMLY